MNTLLTTDLKRWKANSSLILCHIFSPIPSSHLAPIHSQCLSTTAILGHFLFFFHRYFFSSVDDAAAVHLVDDR